MYPTTPKSVWSMTKTGGGGKVAENEWTHCIYIRNHRNLVLDKGLPVVVLHVNMYKTKVYFSSG